MRKIGDKSDDHPVAYTQGRKDKTEGRTKRPESYDLLSFEKKAYLRGYNDAG